MSEFVRAVWHWLPQLVMLAIIFGGMAYYLLALVCAWQMSQRRTVTPPLSASELTPLSLLKPLCGAEPELEECLETFFVQDYPTYEILFAVRTDADPAVAVVNRLRRQYPNIPVTLLYTGEPPYANAKVFSMQMMAAAARHDLLSITDSDTAVTRDFLSSLAQIFADPTVGAATNLYRGVSRGDLWARLEALGMSTEFIAGVVVAERLAGMKFTLGPAMAIRRACLNDIGGFAAMRDYLADDFVLGNWAAAAGWRVRLCAQVVKHHVSTTGFMRAFKHRLRWNRSTRFSRPAGYVGQGFTYGFAWALLFFMLSPAWLMGSLLAVAFGLRVLLALVLGVRLLADQTVWRGLALLPVQDLLSLASWLGGFVGREIIWRAERYRLLEGGRFQLVTARAAGD